LNEQQAAWFEQMMSCTEIYKRRGEMLGYFIAMDRALDLA